MRPICGRVGGGRAVIVQDVLLVSRHDCLQVPLSPRHSPGSLLRVYNPAFLAFLLLPQRTSSQITGLVSLPRRVCAKIGRKAILVFLVLDALCHACLSVFSREGSRAGGSYILCRVAFSAALVRILQYTLFFRMFFISTSAMDPSLPRQSGRNQSSTCDLCEVIEGWSM